MWSINVVPLPSILLSKVRREGQVNQQGKAAAFLNLFSSSFTVDYPQDIHLTSRNSYTWAPKIKAYSPRHALFMERGKINWQKSGKMSSPNHRLNQWLLSWLHTGVIWRALVFPTLRDHDCIERWGLGICIFKGSTHDSSMQRTESHWVPVEKHLGLPRGKCNSDSPQPCQVSEIDSWH